MENIILAEEQKTLIDQRITETGCRQEDVVRTIADGDKRCKRDRVIPNCRYPWGC